VTVVHWVNISEFWCQLNHIKGRQTAAVCHEHMCGNSGLDIIILDRMYKYYETLLYTQSYFNIHNSKDTLHDTVMTSIRQM